MATVTRLGAENPVVIFSRSSCIMCQTTEKFLRELHGNPTIHKLDEHPDGDQMERELVILGCKPSVPAVFIGHQLIGGVMELMRLHLDRKLLPMLRQANGQQP